MRLPSAVSWTTNPRFEPLTPGFQPTTVPLAGVLKSTLAPMAHGAWVAASKQYRIGVNTPALFSEP